MNQCKEGNPMNLRTAREAAGLTQSEAATRIGVDQSAIALWETGKTVPRTRRLRVIAAVYGCSVDALVEPVAGDTPEASGNPT